LTSAITVLVFARKRSGLGISESSAGHKTEVCITFCLARDLCPCLLVLDGASLSISCDEALMRLLSASVKQGTDKQMKQERESELLGPRDMPPE
jgi:hypothetical protein